MTAEQRNRAGMDDVEEGRLQRALAVLAVPGRGYMRMYSKSYCNRLFCPITLLQLSFKVIRRYNRRVVQFSVAPRVQPTPKHIQNTKLQLRPRELHDIS